MAEVPLQLFLMRWLTTHLEATVGEWEDGSPVELQGHVFRGRKFYTEGDFEDAEDTILSILEAPRPLIADAAGVEKVKRQEDWTLLLQGWTKDSKSHPSDPAYYLKAAVERQLSKVVMLDSNGEPAYPSIYRMGERVVDMKIGQGLVRPPEVNVTKYSMFYIPLIIRLVTDVSNPYLTVN